ncbi:MAG TPA: FkbM family methyltransferase [Alphaproteobacteria bacterium]|nr:FkbM family methyltransferase [Alphaproteobacteria bacterium]
MLKLAKDLIRRVSRSFGYDIVPLREMSQCELAAHLGELFAEFDIDCVLDVGANVGQYRDFLRDRVFYGGLIVSFEPVSRNLDILRRRAAGDRHWVVEGYALAADEGTRAINVMAQTEYSSFLQPDYTKLPWDDRCSTVEASETVTMKTLDEVLPSLERRLGFRSPYLKLDTQGYDLEVLRGGLQSLPRICALQTEASVIGIYHGMPGYLDAIRFLGEHAFDVTGFFPVQRDRRLRLIECDCVGVNRAIAQRQANPAPMPRDGRVLVTAQL